jgi:hypothetical protein
MSRWARIARISRSFRTCQIFRIPRIARISQAGAIPLLLLATAAAAAASGAAAASPALAPAEAAQHANEEATVCGLVAGTHFAAHAHGRPTFLDFEKPFPGEVFHVVIWGDDRPRWKQPPEEAYNQKRVCASGKIRLFRGTPEIVVHDPAQLAIR